MLIIRGFLCLVSTIGLWELLKNRCNIKNILLLPSFTIAVQGVFLFAAGILNLLYEVTLIIYVVGILYFAYMCIRHKGYWLKDYGCFEIAYLLSCIIVYGLCVRGKIFSNFDNFTHWAIVVKKMLENNRFPNFQDTIIQYQQYPLGTASIIYYYSRVIGNKEPIQMLAQIYICLTCIIPLFSLLTRNKIFGTVLIIASTNLFLTYNNSITSLYVDGVLGLWFAVSVLFIIVAFEKNKEIIWKYIVCAAIYLSFLIQIKNSAVFFVVIGVITLILYVIKENKKDRGIDRKSLVWLFLPFVLLVFWNKHCGYVYLGSDVSRHAVSFKNYSGVLSTKASADIMTIVKKFIYITFTWKDVLLVLSILVISCIIYGLQTKTSKKSTIIILSSLIIYILWQAGMLAMYLISMPLEEAVKLAGYDRYIRTILIPMLYVSVCLILIVVSNCNKKSGTIMSVIGSGITTVFLIVTIGNKSNSLSIQDDDTDIRWMHSVIQEYHIPPRDSYTVIMNSESRGRSYYYYMGRYLFDTWKTNAIKIESDEDLEGISGNYLLIQDIDNKIVRKWVENNYPEQNGRDVILMNKSCGN